MERSRPLPGDALWRSLVENAIGLFCRLDYRSCDALLIVPPGATLEHPAIGPHLLAACSRQQGMRVGVLYANILFAAAAGESEHQSLCVGSEELWGERVFARAAYGTPVLGRVSESTNRSTYLNLAHVAERWVAELSALIADFGPPVVGCSTMFMQTTASIALLDAIKRRSPNTVAILGGANCQGEMAEGVLTLSEQLDYVFSGESDETFPRFLRSLHEKPMPDRGVIQGAPLLDMDAVPAPEYSEFYEQLELFLPDSEVKKSGNLSLPYESSRGCWWGEKHHCTFCGLNGYGMKFRAKSPERVVNDLRKLLEHHPNRRINMVDNIMPHQYFKTLLPQLADELPNLLVFYEQKSNLSLNKVLALHGAGITLIQPGIESLSTSLLNRMNKGVTAAQNIGLLRYCRAVGITMVWNILYGFPGDSEEDYLSMIDFLPKLQHLNPPAGVFSVCIDRFSPYFERPMEYGITNVRPSEIYATFLPRGAEIQKVAYQFLADFPSGSLESKSVYSDLHSKVVAWHAPWQLGEPPVLEISELSEDLFLLLDTRQLPNVSKFSFLDRASAKLVLTGNKSSETLDVDRALDRSWVIPVDGSLVPLVTADPGLIAKFESEAPSVTVVRKQSSISTIPILSN